MYYQSITDQKSLGNFNIVNDNKVKLRDIKKALTSVTNQNWNFLELFQNRYNSLFRIYHLLVGLGGPFVVLEQVMKEPKQKKQSVWKSMTVRLKENYIAVLNSK